MEKNGAGVYSLHDRNWGSELCAFQFHAGASDYSTRIKPFAGVFLFDAKNMRKPIFNRDDQVRWINRAGREKIDLISDNTPSTAMPSTRNGSNSSHTMGYNMMAKMASGAQSTSNINHNKNVIIT